MAENKSKLENIKNRLIELEAEYAEAVEKLETAKGNYQSIVEGVALGEISKKQLEAVNVEMKRLEDDVDSIAKQIAIVEQVRRKAALEELPLIRDIKRKKFERLQKEYEAQAEVVRKKRDELLIELSKIAAIKAKVPTINEEAKAALEGVEGIRELSHNIREYPTIYSNWGDEADALGLTENIQRQAANGVLPYWLRK